MSEAQNPVGKTQSQGWQIGVRRTFPVTAEHTWHTLMSPRGQALWLGGEADLTLQKRHPYTTTNGTMGDIRSFEAGTLLRMTWQPPDWDFASTLQLRVIPAKTGTTISVHQEKLQNGEQREAMREHWSTVLDGLGRLLEETK